jgi:hypothetical protein
MTQGNAVGGLGMMSLRCVYQVALFDYRSAASSAAIHQRRESLHSVLEF